MTLFSKTGRRRRPLRFVAAAAGCYNTRVKTNRRIFLVGMMGAGKTTVGRQLAKRLGKTFYDADREIESANGRFRGRDLRHRGRSAAFASGKPRSSNS